MTDFPNPARPARSQRWRRYGSRRAPIKAITYSTPSRSPAKTGSSPFLYFVSGLVAGVVLVTAALVLWEPDGIWLGWPGANAGASAPASSH